MKKGKLSSLRSMRAKVVVELGEGEEVNVWYNPAKYTPEFLEELGKMDTVVAIPEIVVEWDLIDDEAETPEGEEPPTYPITTEALRGLPYKFLNALWRAVTDDMLPKREKPTDSGSF